MAERAAVLQVTGLTRRFGGVAAVDGLDLVVRTGETLGIIGPNGAGKSTLVGLVSGAIPASAGSVRLGGQDITRLTPPARTHLGVGRTHQIPRPFGRMSVLENLVLAGRHARGPRESITTTRRRCRAVLERTGLADVESALAGGLPLMRRKRLELARALALRPRLLLLDEIGAGLIEHETAELIELIRRLRSEVEAIVLIEHVMDVITACCDRTAVLDFGKLVTSGPTAQVLADPQVAAVYLGTAAAGSTAAAGRGATGGRGPVAAVPAQEPTAPSVGTGPLLSVRSLQVNYGGVRALRGVDLEVRTGEVVALLGANGAGKTTLARAISGAVRPGAGSVSLDGRRIDGWVPSRITAAGVAHCMEGRRIFATLSVEENLLLAAGSVTTVEASRRLESVYETFPVLADRRAQSGTAMSGGQQQMLAIGRALMSRPRLVIFDEISLGLAPIVVDQLYESLEAVRRTGVAMVLVEQNLERGLTLADRAYVLVHGEVALAGTAEDVRRHPALTALYVGDVADAT